MDKKQVNEIHAKVVQSAINAKLDTIATVVCIPDLVG
jgi:hypothetical protein